MTSLPFICGLAAIIILATELIMWQLFSRRVAGLHFPHEADSSSRIRFFTMARMRICASIHTIFLFVVIEVFLIAIW